ncbi:MAG: hypothetical protein JWN93_2767 [Hyphomicrobiales bacterium]|nr:hypothetical protein [Hyphomicrobiales bacterium]
MSADDRPTRPSRALPRALKLGVASAFVFLTGGPAVIAQFDDSNPAIFWQRDRERMQQRRAPPPRVVQRPTHLIRGAAPRKGFVRELPVEQAAPAAPGAEPQDAPKPVEQAAPAQGDTQQAAAPAAPAKAGAPFTILVTGDNVGQMLAQGLQEAFADRPNVTVLRKARENTGLVRDDYFDWVKAARDLVSGPQPVNVVVMMIGSNDRQPLRDGAASVDPRAPRWAELYGARVQAFANVLKEKNVPLIWVGMPVMKNERLSSGLLEQNEIYREAASRAGASFVDVWEAFVDDRHQFALYGPDVNGQLTKLRTGDGVHFTRAGARKLAYFVERDLRPMLDKLTPAEEPALASAPVPQPPAGEREVRVLVPTQAEDPGQKSQTLAIPLPPAAPMIVIPVRPASGPIVPLTGAAVSPGGQLATRTRNADAKDRGARAIVEQALVQGRPLETRPGRADDFRWPRN